jgi:hypothetical protein
MSTPASNPVPRSDTNAYPGGVKTSRKVGGSRKRPSKPATEPSTTRGKAVTTTGGGGTGGTPGAGREAQDKARGTVHGQPKSGNKVFPGTDPIPNSGH